MAKNKIKGQPENLRALSFSELNAWHNKLANRVNTQMFGKNGLKNKKSNISGENLFYGSAVDKVNQLLQESGKTRFTRGKWQGDYNSLLNETMQLQRLMSWRSYTAKGIKGLEQERVNYFKEKYNSSSVQIRDEVIASHGWYYFTQSKAYDRISKFMASEQVLVTYQNVVDQGHDRKYLEQLYYEYEKESRENGERLNWRAFDQYVKEELANDSANVKKSSLIHPMFEEVTDFEDF